MNKLDEARKVINEVDKQMAELFVKRMRAAEDVFAHKKEHGLPILDEKREAALITKNSEYVEDDVLKGYYIDFLRNMMDISKNYQYRLQSGLKIACCGVEGAFAFIAANKIFPQGNIIPYTDFKSAYNAVTSSDCDIAVLPIENSYAGEVGNVIDLIFSGSLYINGIYNLEIHQNLLGIKGTSKADIKTVISHPQAISQCHEYIKENKLEAIEANNTAAAAKHVSDVGDKSVAAIASADTADLYNLEIIEKNINKSSVNTTRFAVLSKVKAQNKNSVIMFTVSNEAGSLAKAVNIIGEHGFNMTALRSRPLKEHPWQYYFYIETDGNTETEQGQKMIKALSDHCDLLKVAGSFTDGILL